MQDIAIQISHNVLISQPHVSVSVDIGVRKLGVRLYRDIGLWLKSQHQTSLAATVSEKKYCLMLMYSRYVHL